MGEGQKDENTLAQSEDSISEHLSSAPTSIENDRSLNEIEIGNVPNFSLDVNKPEEHNENDQNSNDSHNSSLQRDMNDLKSLTSFGRSITYTI